MIRRVQPGAISIVPIELDANLTDFIYTPRPKDRVVFAQYVHKSYYQKYFVIFDKCLTFEEAEKMEPYEVAQLPVLFLRIATTQWMNNGRWYYHGKTVVSEKIPMQAYQSSWEENGKEVWYAQDYDYQLGEDKGIGYQKQISEEQANKLHDWGESSTLGILEDISRKYFGLADYPYYTLEDYMPKPEGAVWKVFPEYYEQDNWKRV